MIFILIRIYTRLSKNSVTLSYSLNVHRTQYDESRKSCEKCRTMSNSNLPNLMCFGANAAKVLKIAAFSKHTKKKKCFLNCSPKNCLAGSALKFCFLWLCCPQIRLFSPHLPLLIAKLNKDAVLRAVLFNISLWKY